MTLEEVLRECPYLTPIQTWSGITKDEAYTHAADWLRAHGVAMRNDNGVLDVDVLTDDELWDLVREFYGRDAAECASRFRRAVRALKGCDEPTPCQWTEDEDGNRETTCGESFVFDGDRPSDNKVRFCPYCGRPLVEKTWEEPDDEDE